MRPAIDIQLKATINLGNPSNGFFTIGSDLRTTNSCVCRAKRSAYWLNLRGHDETENTSSITVHIPEQNLFNVDNLRMLMEQSRKGSIQ